MAATITHAAVGAAASGLATAAAHQAALDQATIAGIDKTNVDSVTKVVTVGTSDPTTDGEITYHTTSLTGTGGPSRRVRHYNGAASVVMDLANALYSASTPASAYQINGMLWHDMTLNIWRVWRDAGQLGEAGWHPVDDSFQLWKNESGGNLAANVAVIHKASGTNDLRVFTTTTVAKDQAVAGVTLEAINNGNTGVIAVVSGGAFVSILCDDGEADGAIAKGDFIATHTVAGEARTVGAQTANAIVASGNHTVGTPMGAFAVAMGTKDAVTHLVKCKLLGFVGSGAMALIKRTEIVSDTAPETSTAEIDASKVSSGTSGAQGAQSAALTNKHLPFAAVCVDVQFNGTMGAGGSIAQIGFYADGGTLVSHTRAWRGQGSGDSIGGVLGSGWIPTHATGAATTPGNIFRYVYAETNVSSVTSFNMSLVAYLY